VPSHFVQALKLAKKERDHILYLLQKALKQLKVSGTERIENGFLFHPKAASSGYVSE
jgi:hypothetical protein